MNTTQQFNYNQQDLTQQNQQNTSSIGNMEMQNYNVAQQQQQVAYHHQQQMVIPSQPNQIINYNADVLQQINQLVQQMIPTMNFPPLLPCNKPDPFKLRNNPMQIEHSYRGKRGPRIFRLSNEQFYKIELLRIKMLNHIAQCNNPQCESVYAYHIDDGQDKFCNYIEVNKNTIPIGTQSQPAPPFIRIGYNRGLHCAPKPTLSYCLFLIPQCWICLPCLIYAHCQNYDISECQEATILNNESMDLQIDANPNYQCQHSCCCKYTGQRK